MVEKLYNTILVTGCGGDIGLSLGRIIKQEKTATRVIGCDVTENHPGVLIFDAFERVPKATSSNFFSALQKIVDTFDVELIIPMPEAEMSQFLKYGYTKYFHGVPTLLANAKALDIGLDKLKTAHFLKAHDLGYPWTERVRDALPKKTPCILKSRCGQGSKNIVKIEDNHLIEYYKTTRPDDIWQEMLLPENQEFTCGVYRTHTGEIRTIVFHRTLSGGLTSFGVVVYNEKVTKYLERIAALLDLQGSINIQLKLTERGPIVFEINPRFSSTVFFRHLLGFQDFIWSLTEMKGQQLPAFHPPKEGSKIFRGSTEYIWELQ